jgi:hypothetical protein
MSGSQGDYSPTSNDLLHRLVAKHARSEANYQIVVQSAEDVQNIENAPAICNPSIVARDASPTKLPVD